MAVLNVQDEFQSGDNVTATNLNNLVNQANFVDGAGETTDGSTLEVHTSGYLKVKNNGIGDEHLQQMTDTEATTAGNENGRAVTTNHIRNDAVTNAKIAANAVTYAKIQNVTATNRVLGRDSAGAGEVEEISPSALRTMINVEDGATADQTGDEIKTAIGNATQSADGLMSSTDKIKLDGIEADADANVQSDWNATSGDAFILNKPTIPTGTVTEVDAGTGLETTPNTGITGTGTIGISNGGVDTDQLADHAVTADKLENTTVIAGSYTNTNLTVDAQGRITAASSGTVAPEIHSYHTAPILANVADKISVNDFSEGIDTTSSNATKIDQAVGDGGSFKMFKIPASGTCVLEIDAALQDTDNGSSQNFQLDLISCSSETGVTKTSDGSVTMTTLVAGAVTGGSSTAGTRGSSRVKYQKVMTNNTFFYLKVIRNAGATSCNLTATVKVTTY